MGSLVDGLESRAARDSRIEAVGARAGRIRVGASIRTRASMCSTSRSKARRRPARSSTTEGGLQLTVEGQQVGWTDDGQLPDISVTTSRLGYAQDVMWIVDRCTVITGSPDPCSIAMRSSAFTSSIVAIPTPGLSADDTYRLVAGCRVIGRGTQVQVRPLQATTQWSADRCVDHRRAIAQARPEDA